MILTKVEYNENKGKDSFWQIDDVYLSKQNVIVGLNATGKTRLTNVIAALASVLVRKRKLDNGNWTLEFLTDSNKKFSYLLEIKDKVIEKEIIRENGIEILSRQKSKGTILNKTTNIPESYSPPEDELTVNVKRDIDHFPFLEELHTWAKNLKKYSFSGLNKEIIAIPGREESYEDSLSSVPFLLHDHITNIDLVRLIKEDMNNLGYPIDDIFINQVFLQPNLPIYQVSLKENDLKCKTDQIAISSGMFRAFCIISICEIFIHLNKSGTIIIDDLGEGLDFDRSSKLTKLLLKKTYSSNLQLIIVSNDRFLINSVPLNTINYLHRSGHIVKGINIVNSPKVFEKIKYSGLNNFDFLNPKTGLNQN
jgi:hypothetical protein